MKTKLLILLAILLSGCASVSVTVPEGYIESAIRSGYYLGCSEESLNSSKSKEDSEARANSCKLRSEAFDLRTTGIYPPPQPEPIKRTPHDIDRIGGRGGL